MGDLIDKRSKTNVSTLYQKTCILEEAYYCVGQHGVFNKRNVYNPRLTYGTRKDEITKKHNCVKKRVATLGAQLHELLCGKWTIRERCFIVLRELWINVTYKPI